MLKVNYVAPEKVVKANPTDAGWDVSCIEDIVFEPGDCKFLATGLFLEMEKGVENYQPMLAIQRELSAGNHTFGKPIHENRSTPWGKMIDIRGRSGLAKKGFLCHYGTVDETYHSEIGVVLHYNPPETRPMWKKVLNHMFMGLIFNKPSYRFIKGDRVCQLVFMPFYNVELSRVESVKEDRGGFGHTGR